MKTKFHFTAIIVKDIDKKISTLIGYHISFEKIFKSLLRYLLYFLAIGGIFIWLFLLPILAIPSLYTFIIGSIILISNILLFKIIKL